MDAVDKFLKKIGKAESLRLRAVLDKIGDNDLAMLDVQKITDEQDHYRVRTGDKRIKFIKTKSGNLIYHVGYRNDHTY